MKKGFTLIELLVVIAIIGILSGTVISYLGKGGEEESPRDACIRKAGWLSINELPAKCLQYIKVPDWYGQTSE